MSDGRLDVGERVIARVHELAGGERLGPQHVVEQRARELRHAADNQRIKRQNAGIQLAGTVNVFVRVTLLRNSRAPIRIPPHPAIEKEISFISSISN